jgi:hypothetical protein
MVDRQRQIFEDEILEKIAGEVQSNGSALAFEEILKRREENDANAEEKWRGESLRSERLIIHDY